MLRDWIAQFSRIRLIKKKMSMPIQKPGRSKQDYQTPRELLDAIVQELGITWFNLDAAASPENAICTPYFVDALHPDRSWYAEEDGWTWCNPPFGRIAPWVEKAYKESQLEGAKIAMLVPASVGSNWWGDWVHEKASVLFLSPRITFVGEKAPFPKDCALLLYKSWMDTPYRWWRWKD